MLDKSFKELMKEYENLIAKKNSESSFNNGIYKRFNNPVLTREHIPPFWRYDFDLNDNPHKMERLGINAVFNSGAFYKGGKYYLAARIEGNDRKSFFAIAQSDSGTDGFRFWDYPISLPDTKIDETNVYDMRLTEHEDGYIYGVFCSESKDNDTPEAKNDLSAAKAEAGIVRTKDLKNWERLPNLISKSQQRNVVLHPEFVDGKYAFYTRPQDGFIDTGSGGGIGFALCDDIENPIIHDEKIINQRRYHTITEVKNGAGAVPIKTEKGWIHIAHGVRNTAAGLRYVIYVFATDLNDPSKCIAEPSGVFIVPLGSERVGDVSNVAFTNGAIVNEKGEVFIYYASSDTRLHVAKTTIEKLIDYTFNTPKDPLRSPDCVKQRIALIEKNLDIMKKDTAETSLIEGEYQKWLSNVDDDETMWQLRDMSENYEEKLDCFYQNLSFGTGGLRGKTGAGTNRMNKYTLGKCTQGLADYLNSVGKDSSVVIAYDTRNKSNYFANIAAEIFAENGISVYLFSSVRPTPMLSFAVSELKADCGIVITASHNPKEYNGYKVYGNDGGQLTDNMADSVLKFMNACDIFKDIKFAKTDEKQSDKIKLIDEEIDKVYYEKVKDLILRKDLIKNNAKDLKIIYTPIHGSGYVPVSRVLSELGFSDVNIVPEQSLPNGDFPTAPYPNPEDPKVFKLALKMAESLNPDIIFGTDPDCDRIGVLAKDQNGKYQILTGNQLGFLLSDYIIKTLKDQNQMPNNPAIIKTIVTSDLTNLICKKEGIACFDVLTGFKYIAELVGKWHEDGTHSFIFGFEESYGYLRGDFVRDKDAVIASALVAEMALYYKKERNMTLIDALEDVYQRYGYTQEELINLDMQGKDGQEKMQSIMSDLRNNYVDIFKEQELLAVEDYLSKERKIIKENKIEEIDLPKSNVLKFIFSDGSWLVLRPSGTEPKIKLYLYAISDNKDGAKNRIDALTSLVNKILPK